jgi:hypothetical protein
MEHKRVLALCSEIHTRHRNTLHNHNAGFLMLNLVRVVKVEFTLEQAMKAPRGGVEV